MRTTRRVSLFLVAAVRAYHQSEFEGLWEQVVAPQVEFDLHPDERIEIDDDDDVLRRELGI